MAFTKATYDYLDSGGLINWQLTAKTSAFTAVSGEGYLVDTSSAAVTVTLPDTPSAGDEIIIVDYASNAGTNNITLDPGTLNLRGATDDLVLSTNNQTARLLYSGATKGWLVTTEAGGGAAAAAGPYDIDYLLVAGGGSGGNNDGGGGGAGGLLESTISSIAIGETLTISIGGGGAATSVSSYSSTKGTDSTISSSAITTIRALAGGAGIADGTTSGGTGVSGQGYAGGAGYFESGGPYAGGGGGGAGAAGTDGSSSGGGSGGIGAITTIISISNATTSSVGELVSSSLYFAGGGGAGEEGISGNAYGTGGYGGGGDGNSESNPENGTLNTGGGGGGYGYTSQHLAAGNGGSGVCILRMPTASYSGTTTNSPDVYTEGSDTVLVYKIGGTYTT